MKFFVYTGEKASNSSVNITKLGTFEAESIKSALDIIDLNYKKRYCEKWMFVTEDKKKYVECLRENFCSLRLFVCSEDNPISSNVIWKDKKAIINFFERKENEKSY